MWSGDGAVEQQFDGGKVSSLGADIAGVLDAIAADGEANATGVGFFGAISCDDAEVSGFLVPWDLVGRDEKHGVGARGHVCAMALAELAEFVFA